MRSRAQTAERRDVLVCDCKRRQRFGKHIAIVLRIRARARNAAHVGEKFDLGCLEQVDELAHRPCGMSDGEERIGHLVRRSPASLACVRLAQRDAIRTAPSAGTLHLYLAQKIRLKTVNSMELESAAPVERLRKRSP